MKYFVRKMSDLHKIQGFNVISVKATPSSTCLHYFFVKQHALREKTVYKPSDRTLFVINVPSYCTEDMMKFAWQGCGTVKTVYFHEKPSAGVPPEEQSSFFPSQKPITGIKVAYVVFESPKGLNNALKYPNTTALLLSNDEIPMSTGLSSWVKEYNSSLTKSDELEKDIEAFMKAYDAEEKERKTKEKEMGEEDEEGWITVTKGGRHPGFARKENVTRKIKEIEEKKRSKKELLNFYSFQLRESKMKNLMALRKKFEEDKKKIATFKQTRKFKPF